MPTAARRVVQALALGAVVFAALVESGWLAFVRGENCFDWASEGRTAAIASPQGRLCGRSEDEWTPDLLLTVGALAIAVVVALVLWRRWGSAGWVGGLLVVLVVPVLAHVALVLPPDECSAETIEANGGRDCSTDREQGPDLPPASE